MIQKQAFIYFDSLEPLLASWVVFDADGKVAQTATGRDLSELTAYARECELIAIVPAHEVVLTQAMLPKLNRQRLLQALPYALEEQLIDDVSELHFAIAPHTADGTLPVAIVAKEKMNLWLNALSSFELHPVELISGTFVLPYNEKTWDIGIQADTCAVRTGAYHGFSCDRANLGALLELSLSTAEPKPDVVQVYNFSQTELEPLNISLDGTVMNIIALSEASFLENVAAWVMAHPRLNLLQGEYQTKGKSSEVKKIWLYACYAALAWLGLGFFKNLVSFFILHHAASHLDSAINVIYKKNFPNATSVVAPRDRMTSKLETLTNFAGNNVYLTLLAKTGSVLKQHATITLKSLDFRDNRLNLELNAATFDDIDTLIKNLTQQGLMVKEQNAAISGTQVKTNLVIQRGSA